MACSLDANVLSLFSIHGLHNSQRSTWRSWHIVSAVWETCTEYHCTPTKVFLSFSQSLRRPPTVATLAQAIQLAQGPIN